MRNGRGLGLGWLGRFGEYSGRLLLQCARPPSSLPFQFLLGLRCAAPVPLELYCWPFDYLMGQENGIVFFDRRYCCCKRLPESQDILFEYSSTVSTTVCSECFVVLGALVVLTSAPIILVVLDKYAQCLSCRGRNIECSGCCLTFFSVRGAGGWRLRRHASDYDSCCGIECRAFIVVYSVMPFTSAL